MTRWVHVESFTFADGVGTPVCRDCWAAEQTPCTTPTPDPASPCGFVLDGLPCERPGDSRWHHCPCNMREGWSSAHHPHHPTRCKKCGHAIREVKP